jgi:hypothetical protein
MGIVVVVAIFVLLQKEDLRDRLIRLFGATDLHKTTVAMDDAARRLSKYFLTQLAINTSFGILIGIGLYFIGLPNPLLWGILSGLLRFVPYIGAFISAALPLALAMAVDPGWSMVIWTGGLYVGGEVLVSQAIEPVLYGHSTGLSPFAVIVAAIFWSWMWGPIGLILSMPLTLSVVVLGRYVERLAFLDILLGDRPALTPIESFYQRILAGDEDEALDHAELLLKERSLSSYYDEVILNPRCSSPKCRAPCEPRRSRSFVVWEGRAPGRVGSTLPNSSPKRSFLGPTPVVSGRCCSRRGKGPPCRRCSPSCWPYCLRSCPNGRLS